MKTRQTHLRLERDRRSASAKKHRKPHRAKIRASLPDLSPKPGALLLVGLCSIAAVAKTGHYFQGQYGKRVWKKLARARLLKDATPGAEDVAWVLAGHGITDVVKRSARSHADLTRVEITRGVEALRVKIRSWSPRGILFTFKNAAEVVLGERKLSPGPCASFEGVPTFLLTGPYAKPGEAEEEAAKLGKL